ncbi:MAG: deoxyhypusine synthase family protein [Candidatus Lernaella stagnicola]|nr:deoxyhypusine synthase family protein [Candidatus Lernaella stagnicola]
MEKRKARKKIEKMETYKPKLTPRARQRKKKVLDNPTRSMEPKKGMRVADMVDAMKGMSIQARNIGNCARVLDGMYTDKRRPTVFLGLAGPLIAAGLRNVIRELIAGGYVDVVVSTGAILYQDIYQARGYKHFQGSPLADDRVLREMFIDRIYDTFVDEEAFWETDMWIGKKAGELPPGIYSSRQFMDYVGSLLHDEKSIVRTCHKRGVPMFVPALNDSSIGIGLTEHRHRCRLLDKPGVVIDSIQDNYELTQIVVQSNASAAFYVAGGVPKNYINDAVVMGYIFNQERGHDYALQVTTAVVSDGGLSSSTLREATSWGKIDPRARYSMAWVEPSVALPLLAQYTFDRHPKRKPIKYTWDNDILKATELPPAAKKPTKRPRRR